MGTDLGDVYDETKPDKYSLPWGNRVFLDIISIYFHSVRRSHRPKERSGVHL